MMYVIIGIILVLGVLFIIYKIRSADTIENQAKDLLEKGNALKAAIYNDTFNLLVDQEMEVQRATSVARGVVTVCFAMDLKKLEENISLGEIMKSCDLVFEKFPDIKEIVISYLRMRYVNHAGMTGELLYDINSPTGELTTKYGAEIPSFNEYHTFFGMYYRFIDKRLNS